MIDEKQLIEELQGMPDECMLFRWCSAKKIKEGLVRIINAQPKVGEWIPCSERLPEVGRKVLTIDKWGHIRDRELYRFWCGEMLFRPDGLCPVRDITHWMPLPEPYEEEK